MPVGFFPLLLMNVLGSFIVAESISVILKFVLFLPPISDLTLILLQAKDLEVAYVGDCIVLYLLSALTATCLLLVFLNVTLCMRRRL